MQLRDLPSDILFLVLEQAAQHNNHMDRAYKDSLRLAAVCRRWRHIALPIIHRSAMIRLKTTGPVRGTAQSAGNSPEVVEIKTNLDLIFLAGCTKSVKRVSIVAHRAENALPSVETVLQMMKAAAEKWGGVRELMIALCFDVNTPQVGVGLAENKDSMVRIFTAITTMMPGVRQLVLSRGHAPVYRSLYWRLVRNYADQLWMLNATCPADLPQDLALSQLRQLRINCSTMVGHHSTVIDPQNLTSLEILDCQQNHSWSPFATNKDASVVVFPKLKALDVSYFETDEWEGDEMQQQDAGPWKLHFPKLDYLNLVCEQSACPLLRQAVFPPHVDTISVMVSVPVLLDMVDMPLPTTENIDISINMGQEDPHAALDAANRIFERAKGATTMELALCNDLLSMPPEAIHPLLTRLEMHAPTDVATVIKLIRRLPNLTTLSFWVLILGNAQLDMVIPEPGADCLVEPLNTKIEALVLNSKERERQQAVLVTLVKYILLLIPSLKNVRADGAPKSAILNFIDAYLEWHPHLTDIVFELGCKDVESDLPQQFRTMFSVCHRTHAVQAG